MNILKIKLMMCAALCSVTSGLVGAAENQNTIRLKNGKDLAISDAALLQCPDEAIVGRTIKEVFPFFTEQAFVNGMIMTNMVTGDKRPMTTVKLNGRWWNVYAMDKGESYEYGNYSLADLDNPAQAAGQPSYYAPSIAYVAEPYAKRFNTPLRSLLREKDRWGDSNGAYVSYGLIKRSVVAKKLQDAVQSSDNGIFWKRDTIFADNQNQMCTYLASGYSPQHYSYDKNRKNYSFVFEPTNAPREDEFAARKNGFMARVYAERRAYYMRHQNLGQYSIDPQDNPNDARTKVMGEFKERIARDRIYQDQDRNQREEGRIYGISPSRIYQSTRNVTNSMSVDEREFRNSDDYNNRIYYYTRQADAQMGNSSAALANQRFDAMSSGSVDQRSMFAAQRQAENKIADSSSNESKGDD